MQAQGPLRPRCALIRFCLTAARRLHPCDGACLRSGDAQRVEATADGRGRPFVLANVGDAPRPDAVDRRDRAPRPSRGADPRQSTKSGDVGPTPPLPPAPPPGRRIRSVDAASPPADACAPRNSRNAAHAPRPAAHDMRDAARPARVAVLGAGIVGISAAVWLRRAGLEVALIDREAPGAGATYGTPACSLLRPCSPSPRRGSAQRLLGCCLILRALFSCWGAPMLRIASLPSGFFRLFPIRGVL
jgi:Glycine/D-amino acid oxidases (deaminating)